jgi:hypothetical protein
MSRATIILRSSADRARALRLIGDVPDGTRVEFKASKRTLPQNDRLWAMLTDVSRQVEWYGRKRTPEDWKDMFTASLRKAEVVPGLDSGTFVVLGLHTSKLTKDEFSNLLELIAAFGAERGVTFHDGEQVAA